MQLLACYHATIEVPYFLSLLAFCVIHVYILPLHHVHPRRRRRRRGQGIGDDDDKILDDDGKETFTKDVLVSAPFDTSGRIFVPT